MKIILKRVFWELKGRKSKSVLTVLFSLIFGFSTAIISCYICATEVYLDAINKQFPAEIWLITKKETEYSPEESVIEQAKNHSNIVSFTDYSDKTVAEFTVDKYSNVDKVLLDLSLLLSENSEYIFVDASNYNNKQLVKSLEISVSMQNLVLFSSCAVLLLLLILIFVLNISEFNKDAKILLRLGETNKNINKQFLFSQALISYLPVLISSCVGLSFNRMISHSWVIGMTKDFKEGSSLESFETQQQFLFTVHSNEHIYIFLLILLLSVIIYLISFLLFKHIQQH